MRERDEPTAPTRDLAAPLVEDTRRADAATSSPPEAKRDPGRAHVEIRGAYLHASDPKEGRHERGSAIATVGVRPITALEIAARYQGTFGAWTYLTTQPSTTGGQNAKLTAVERIHRADLGLRFDVLRTLDVPLRLEPYVGGLFQGIDSSVLSAKFAGAGGGLTLALEPDARFAVELSGAALGGADLGNGGRALYGAPISVWNCSGGVSVGITDSARLNFRYLGEWLSREHTTRVTNGAMLAFDIAFGKTTSSSSISANHPLTSHVATAIHRGALAFLENDRGRPATFPSPPSPCSSSPSEVRARKSLCRPSPTRARTS
jgi:hypothetical protein